MADLLGMDARVALWNEINAYAESCGANTAKHVYGNTRRMDAVAAVESVVSAAIAAAVEAERERCAQMAADEAAHHALALAECEAADTPEPDTAAMHAEEYARQCCADLADRIRSRPTPAAAETSALRHTTNAEGDCVGWCRACDENVRRGFEPDGTPRSTPAAAEGTVDPECICGEINARHCPVHNDAPSSGRGGEGGERG